MKHLIEWDSIEIRVDGERVNALAQDYRVEPIEKLELLFLNGLLRVQGSIRKFISVPFTVDIREIRPDGLTIRVPLASVQAFGGLPVPQFLLGLVRDRLPKDVVTFEAPATFVLSLVRFLPSFVDADIQKIWIIEGGLAITLGRGGADPPVPET
jgi:hypothetical protein